MRALLLDSHLWAGSHNAGSAPSTQTSPISDLIGEHCLQWNTIFGWLTALGQRKGKTLLCFVLFDPVSCKWPHCRSRYLTSAACQEQLHSSSTLSSACILEASKCRASLGIYHGMNLLLLLSPSLKGKMLSIKQRLKSTTSLLTTHTKQSCRLQKEPNTTPEESLRHCTHYFTCRCCTQGLISAHNAEKQEKEQALRLPQLQSHLKGKRL